MIRLKRNQRGDTIVEVLIAVAVTAAILGGAYVITNKSVKNSLQAQEHSVALKIAETQVEQIKALAEQPNSVVFSENTMPFHTTSTTTVDGIQTVDGRYRVSVTRDTSVPPKFSVRVEWDGATSKTDSVSLVYKVGQ